MLSEKTIQKKEGIKARLNFPRISADLALAITLLDSYLYELEVRILEIVVLIIFLKHCYDFLLYSFQ